MTVNGFNFGQNYFSHMMSQGHARLNIELPCSQAMKITVRQNSTMIFGCCDIDRHPQHANHEFGRIVWDSDTKDSKLGES
jgi:hypothetical protein